MAKIPFSKLKCKLDNEVKIIEFAGENIEVKQYLPVQDKLRLISRVIVKSHEEDANYVNPMKVKVFTELEIVFDYTNISFTEKQREDIPKLYDALLSSGALSLILAAIPDSELADLNKGVNESIVEIYRYQNSAVGILDRITNSYDETKFDIKSLQEALGQLEGSSLLAEIRPLLGLDD